jgi:hypothetical protein
VDTTGTALPAFWLDRVRAVHDAACRRDYDALTQQMSDPFRRLPPRMVADEWRSSSGKIHLDVLAATLETVGHLDQGGLVFCQQNGAYAVFARGTHDRSGEWNDFDLVRDNGIPLPEQCD